MNYLDILANIMKFKQKKQKTGSIKNIAILSALGIAITGIALVLVAQSCSNEIKKIVISKANDMANDEDEIKQAIEKVDDEELGDVGLAMEDALEDLESKPETPK